jgi:hypothetical protein
MRNPPASHYSSEQVVDQRTNAGLVLYQDMASRFAENSMEKVFL